MYYSYQKLHRDLGDYRGMSKGICLTLLLAAENNHELQKVPGRDSKQITLEYLERSCYSNPLSKMAVV